MSDQAARVLIVEDEAIVAMDLHRRIERLGHHVVGEAATGEAAIERAGALRPDLVLMDIRLRGAMDGVAAAEELRRTWGMPVVFLTAFSDPATVQRAAAAEPFGYVVKPVDDRELEIAIAVALGRRHADRRVRRMERWLAATLTSIGDAVIATDLQGEITFMNAAAERLTGWPREEALGRSADAIVALTSGEEAAAPAGAVARALAGSVGPAPVLRQSLLRRSGQRVPVEDSVSPVRDDHGDLLGVVLVIRDVTRQEQMAEDLRRSQKLEAVGQLAGGVAHEFNNLMTVVLGVSELVLDDPRLDDELRGSLVDIRQAGERAAALTRQLLTVGRRQMFAPHVIDLDLVVAECAGTLAALLGKSVRLVTKPAGSRACIRADKPMVEQLLVNLAANGRDAMREGGTLTIATSRDAAEVVLEVGDTGAGMTPDVMAHLFEPFFTTKDVGKGSGLGLAAVHGAVALARGRIDVSSSPGEGTTFRIVFPAAE